VIVGPAAGFDPEPRGFASNRTIASITASFAVLLSVAALGIGAAVDMPSTLMSRADYDSAGKSIDVEARAQLERCREARGHARDLCKAEARSESRVKKADLFARYHGTVAAAEEARLEREQSRYEVTKVHCAVLEGAQRAECLRTAREEKRRAAASEAEPAAT
jgi:hypothetical protein